jgi:preprotein translocase subunit SecG
MTTLIIVIHIIVCLFLIGIVLLQHGKGADVGASFGGSSQSLFGTEGPLPLLNKITTLAAIVFMGTSVALAYLSAHKTSGSVMSEVKVQTQQDPTPAQETPVTVPMPTAGQPAETPKGSGEQPAKK